MPINNIQKFLEIETFTIFSQIINAISYFHEIGVIHRDLTVFNILIEPKTLHIKIIDFGLSKMTKDVTATLYSLSSLSTPTGLITLRAPEVLLQIEYNEKVDIWMAGLVLLSILTNECFPTKKSANFFNNFSKILLILIKLKIINFYSVLITHTKEKNNAYLLKVL